MRILLLIHRLWNGGGTETHVLALATELRGAGHTVGVFTEGGPWVHVFRANGIPVHVSLARDGRLVALQRLIAERGYEVLHGHDAESFQLIKRLREDRPFAAVFTVHGRYVDARTLRTCAPAAGAVVTVSAALHQYVAASGVPQEKIHDVVNGVSTSVYHPQKRSVVRQRLNIPHDAFVVGYAGRFTGDKLRLSRRTSGLLREYTGAHPNVHALIAGRESRVHERSGERVHVLGAVSDMAAFYRACDVVIGTGRVALEALACGVPTIAGGHAEYIGRITPATSAVMDRTNFGDHGPHRRAWRSADVFRDLEAVRRHLEGARRDAAVLVPIVQRKFSARRMATHIIRLYGVQIAAQRGRIRPIPGAQN